MRPNEKLPMKSTGVNHVTLGEHSSEGGLNENYIIEGPLTQHPRTHHPHALSGSSGVIVTLPNFTNHLVVSSSPSQITCRAVFFLRIFCMWPKWQSSSGRFRPCYKPDMKYKTLIILLYL
jgi:hypothetical protein